MEAQQDIESVAPELEGFVREEIRSKLKEKGLEYRTRVVEEAMTPLIDEVTSLSQHSLNGGQKKRKKREPQKLSKLIQLVDMATRNFLAVGEEISHENPDFQEELIAACDDVRGYGETLQAAAAQFSQSPCEPDNRTKMAKASKDLLLSVTRLMVVADMVDVHNLLEASSRIETKLRSLQTATTERELMEKLGDCSADIIFITQRGSIQSNDQRSEACLQLLATAQVELNQAKRMIATTSKAFIQFKGAKTARENQEYVVLRLLDSLKTLSLLATGDDKSFTNITQAEPGVLAICFENFKEHLKEAASFPSDLLFSDIKVVIPKIHKELEEILHLTSEVASSQSTRDYRQHTLISLCGQLRSNMADLEPAILEGKRVRELVTDMETEALELRRELCRAAIDRVSDVFMSTLGPLVSLCEVAQEGHTQLLQDSVLLFERHANSMLNAAQLSCTISDNAKGNQTAHNATKNVQILMPQVVNAAYTLAWNPSSVIALKNLSVFKEAWAENVSSLTDAVDTITSLVEFMAITEIHICEDGQEFIEATEACNTMLLGDVVEVIRGRCKRLCHVVKAELKRNKDSYTQEQIHQSHGAMEKLIMKSVSRFCDLASKANETLYMTKDLHRVDFKALEEALQKVVDNVRNVRRSILVACAPGELEGNESDLEDLLRPPRPITPTPSLLSQISTGSASTLLNGQGSAQRFQRTPRHSMVFQVEDTTKDMLAHLPQEQRAQLTRVAEGLTAQQAIFETEVSKWDDSNNDIVSLAKAMCGMMIDMSDFTRGLGPLQSIMDVMVTAKDIVRAAGRLDEVARSIADHCPDVQCQRDIHSYLNQIRLYSRQLEINARVKADLRVSASEAVDNVSTLITTSKNLMNKVVETVKTCYIASTAIARIHGGPASDQFVQWRLTLPCKKKLYCSDSDLSAVMEGSAAVIELGKFKYGHNDPLMSTVAELPET